MRRLHLLEVGLRWPPEAYLQRKLEGLAARGLRVTVAAEIDRRAVPQRLRGVELLRLSRGDEPRLVKAFWLVRDGLALALRNPRRLRRLLRAVRRPRLLRASLPLVLADADVVHFEWESTALDFLPLFEAYGSPVVVSSHGGINVRPQMGDERVTAGYPLIFDKATAVHCVSEAILREATRYGLDPRKARVIRTAVDTDFFTPGTRARADELRVVAVGELNWIKGYTDALEAIARLVSEGVPVSYEVIGGEPLKDSGKPSDRSRLLYLIHELGLRDRVRLLGELSQHEVREHLQRSDVLLQASLAEGLPSAVLEAMACALPVVVTDCGGLREAVTDGIEGFVCPRRSPEALAESLRALWRDPQRARRIGEAGRARVLAEFALPQQIESFVRFYEALSSAPRLAAGAPQLPGDTKA
jgi:colanic acid/amylovoran biosynthesis glycosyltransferase